MTTRKVRADRLRVGDVVLVSFTRTDWRIACAVLSARLLSGIVEVQYQVIPRQIWRTGGQWTMVRLRSELVTVLED